MSGHTDPNNVYHIVLDTDQVPGHQDHGFTFDLSQPGVGVSTVDCSGHGHGHAHAHSGSGSEALEILSLHPQHQQQSESQDITYIEVASNAGCLYPSKIDLLLEYGPGWRSDLLQDIYSSCTEMFSYPVFCRDGVFWSNKLLLASVSKMVSQAISTADPESCLVIPDISKHDLKRFYDATFRNVQEKESLKSIKNVGGTLSVYGFHSSEVDEEVHEEYDEDDHVPEIFDCLKKSDKLKLSQYFNHEQSKSGVHKTEMDNIMLGPFKQNCFQCKLCGRKFSDSIQLERHKKHVHNKKMQDTPLNKPYQCPNCPRRFNFKCNVRRHLWLHHKFQVNSKNNSCFKSMNNLEIVKSRTKIEKMEDIKCKICNKYFPSWKKLQMHMYDHTSDRPFSCEECGRGFKEESKLRRHSLIHSGIKPFNCSHCGKSFSLKQNRDIHERLHTGEGYKCNYCNDVISQKVNLRKHELKHEKLLHIKTDNPQIKERQAFTNSKNFVNIKNNFLERPIAPKLVILNASSIENK